MLENTSFILKNCNFTNNYAFISGGAIFFESTIPSSFKKDESIYIKNVAKYYGNDWATFPFRLCLTNNTINIKDFKPEYIIRSPLETMSIQSLAGFDFNYFVWIVDQFLQPAFTDSKMYLIYFFHL